MTSRFSLTYSSVMYCQLSQSLVAVAVLRMAGMYQLFCSKGTAIAGSFDAKPEWSNLGQLREREVQV